MSEIFIALIKIIPSVLWFLLIIIVFLMFYHPIREELLPHLKEFKAMGIELSFIRDFIDSALELAEKSPEWGIKVSSSAKKRALQRVKKHPKIFEDVQILWVDDHPENNLNERKMFRHLKAEIDTAKSTEEALEILKHGGYDLVISDMARGDKPTAGLEFLKQFREIDNTTPVIFYLGVLDPEKGVPAQAFGITNRPDELIHLTFDVLERKKY